MTKLILFGEGSLRRALTQFQEHYLSERNHQGKGNILLFPRADELPKTRGPSIESRERLGGLLKYYYREGRMSFWRCGKDLWLGLKKACRKAGLDDVTWHTFRHTFASRLTRNGARS